MSESQSIDRPRVWYKEMIKSRRMKLFDAGLVGGPYHRDYLVDLGMPADRVALGYNAVDNAFYEARADQWRNQPDARDGLPAAPYFLSVCRFAPEKNLIRLIEAFGLYRGQADPDEAWDLVLCGGGPLEREVQTAVERSGWGSAVHRPGFLQADALSRWYAFAGGFVLASVSEPWGLVANEAAAASLPLLLSSRSGCARTLVPDPEGTTGARFDPFEVREMAAKMAWLAERPEAERLAIGRRAREVVSAWGPERFAQGAVEAWEIARRSPRRRASLLRKGS